MSELVKVLKTNDVHVSSKGNICLNDFIEEIIGSKNPDQYMKKIKNKFVYKQKYYITQDACLEILEQGKSKKCKEILAEINENDDEDNGSIISVEDKLFQYEGNKFTSFFIMKENDEWDVWLKGKEVAHFLEYEKPKNAISRHIDGDNKMRYEKLLELSGVDKLYKNIDTQTIFINYNGLLQLICKSKQHKSIDFAKFLDIPIFHKKTYHEQEIILQLSKFFKASKTNYCLQYSAPYGNHNYHIDCYLPDYKIAIEIDENGHLDRDAKYEINRERRIRKKLKCKFMRCNPDDPKFSLFEFIGLISREIMI